MSIGGDDYDERGRPGGSDPSGRRASARSGTRIRLPGEDGGIYRDGKRPPARPGRSLLTVLSVVVLLIAAIAFANRGGSSDSDSDGGGDGGSQAEEPKGGEAQPTHPTGEKPAKGKDEVTGIPSGFTQSEQGAQSAATNYAVALGSEGMFDPVQRAAILDAVITPSAVSKYKTELDKAYSPAFLERAGLKSDGTEPEGMTFVSRTSPIGSKVTAYSETSATVEVWCSGLLGLAGDESTKPITNQWFTITFELAWADGDWKTATHSQTEGPTPVNGDNRVSKGKVLAEAVEGYGGFTYAR